LLRVAVSPVSPRGSECLHRAAPRAERAPRRRTSRAHAWGLSPSVHWELEDEQHPTHDPAGSPTRHGPP